MAIEEEDRAKLGALALRAIDSIVERFGPEADLEDAVLVYEVSYPSQEREGERDQEVDSEATTHRASVVVGLCEVQAALSLEGWERG